MVLHLGATIVQEDRQRSYSRFSRRMVGVVVAETSYALQSVLATAATDLLSPVIYLIVSYCNLRFSSATTICQRRYVALEAVETHLH